MSGIPGEMNQNGEVNGRVYFPFHTGKLVAVATGQDTVEVAVGAQSLTSKTLCNQSQPVATTLGVPHVEYIFTD